MSSSTRTARACVFATASLLFLACVATSPLVPLFDPDEGYYPATAREMLDAGTAWDPTLDGRPRWDKPILSYLLIEGAFALAGTSEVTARLPSAIEGMVGVIIGGLITLRIAGPLAGVVAAIVLASTLGLQVFARAAHPEIAVVLSIFTTELIFVLWLVADEHRRAHLTALAALSIGIGVLAKGPVAAVLPALAAVAAAPFLSSRPRVSQVLKHGSAAITGGFLIAAPWYALMTARHGLAFLQESLWRHNVVRYSTGAFGHGAGPWFFVLPTAVALLPWTPLVVQAARSAHRQPTAPRVTLAVCMLAAAGSSFVFYSLSSSKLPNYALVIVPPLAIVIGLFLADQLERSDGSKRSELVAGATLLVLGLALAAVPMAISQGANARVLLGGAPSRSADVAASVWTAVLPAAVVCIGAAAVVGFARNRMAAIAALALAGFLLPLVLLVAAAPLLSQAYPWEELGSALAGQPGILWLYRYRAPSLTFYAHRPVEPLSDPDALKETLSRGNGWLVLDDRAWESIAIDSARVRVVDQRGRMRLLKLGEVPAR